MRDVIGQLLLQLALILINAFFAATEIAVISLNEKKVKARAEEGDKKAKTMLKMIESPTGFLSTIQVGITLAGFLGSAFAADNFATRLSGYLMKTFSLPEAYAAPINTASVVVITLVLSFFTLVLGELVPKRVAMQNKERLAEAVCSLISVLAVLLKPVIWLLTVSTNGVLRLLGIDPNAKEEPVSEEDIVLMLDAGADEGSLNEDDITYIKNVFKLDRLSARKVMTPRKMVTFLSLDATEEEILQIVSKEGHPRIPVYEEDDDHVVGILHAREYLLRRSDPDFTLASILHQPVFVPETVALDQLFKDMQTSHTHLVVVVNEYGETAGVVSIEDILEELVGEIWGEEEDEESDPNFISLNDSTYRASGATSLEAFATFFGQGRPETAATDLSGWLIAHFDAVPDIGDTLRYGSLTVTVMEADDDAVLAVTIRREEKKN